jgi:hypothetical protein
MNNKVKIKVECSKQSFMNNKVKIKVECSKQKMSSIYMYRNQEGIYRHGILRERASVARGRFFSDCGRKCGNH